MPPKSQRRAFTLVELLVVIGIIAVLIGILLPSLTKARRAANTTKCLSQVHQLSVAWQMYGQAHRGRSIPYYTTNPNDPTDTGLSLWIGQLREVYSDVDNSRFCPEAREPSDSSRKYSGGIFMAWGPAPYGTGGGVQQLWNQSGSYGFNGWLYDYDTGYTAGASPHRAGQFFNSFPDNQFFDFPVARPADVPCFCDCVWVDSFPKPTDPAPATLHPSTFNTSSGLSRECMLRHVRGVNISFCDGHAATVACQDLWTLTWKPGWVAPNPLPTMPAN